MFASLRHRLERHGPWPRRLAALVCLALAGFTALSGHHSAAGGTPTTPVAVSTRALPAGHILTTRDVRVRSYPTTVAPRGAASTTHPLLGRRLAGSLAAGEPITEQRLVGRTLAAGLPSGTVAIGLPVDDEHVADFVHAGDRVDVLPPAPSGDASAGPSYDDQSRDSAHTTPLAVRLLVLAVLAPQAPDSGTSEGQTPEIVVAAAEAVAVRLAAFRGIAPFAVFTSSP